MQVFEMAHGSSTAKKTSRTTEADKKNVIGARMRTLREKLGIFQDDIAALMRARGHQLGRVQVNKIEMGRRFVSDVELLTIAELLQVTPHELLGFDPPQKR